MTMPDSTTTASDAVYEAIIALDAQASRCFKEADKLHRRDLAKARRLASLGVQAKDRSLAKRKIWNEMRSSISVRPQAATERAKLEEALAEFKIAVFPHVLKLIAHAEEAAGG